MLDLACIMLLFLNTVTFEMCCIHIYTQKYMWSEIIGQEVDKRSNADAGLE